MLGLGLRLLLSKTVGKLPLLRGHLFTPPVAFGVLAGELTLTLTLTLTLVLT